MPQEPEWEGQTPPSASTKPKYGFLSKAKGAFAWPATSTSSPPAPRQDIASAIPLSGSEKDIETSGPPAATGPPAAKYTFRDHLDRYMPPHRRYLGLSRRIFLFILLGLIICLLALILGLGLGLGLKHKNGAEDLPLPSNSATFTGDLTYYAPGLGACGVTSTDNDPICAVSHIIFDAAASPGASNPNADPLCGKKIRVQRFDEQVGANRSIDVTVVDRCVGCKADDLDLSPAMFSMLADMSLGRVTGTWAWLP